MYEYKSSGRALTADGQVTGAFSADEQPLLGALPGARRDKATGVWRVSREGKDRRALLEGANLLGLEVGPALREIAPTEAAGRAQEAGLYPFQVEGADWLSRRRRGLLADEMGLGKSAQALIALPEQVRALVVCPAALKYNWAEEVRRWRPDLTPAVLEGKGSFRAAKSGEVVILNYELLPAELARPSAVSLTLRQKLGRSHLILDEAHYVKNRRTTRSKRAGGLATLAGTAWGLTGTPPAQPPRRSLRCAGPSGTGGRGVR